MNKIDYSHSFTGEDNNKRNYLNQKELINIKHYMKTLKQDLGKVSVTCNGVWDAGRNYDRLCIVNDGNFASYISKKFAPEGILLSNEEYWQPIASLRDDIKIDYDKFKKEWIQMLTEIQLKLKASRIVVENDIERESLSWLQVAAGCEVYVKDTKLSWILESIVPVLNYKEWRLESDSKIDSVPTYELTGEFENLIADRTIADRWGHIIDEYYVTRDMVTNFIIETVRKYIHEAAILPGSIKPEDLSQAVLDLIGYGQITNLADEEDLTDYTNANGTHVLRFKDKVYNEADGSGLGRVYLRKNKVQGVNTLVQQMVDKPNTIYIVQYDYTLGEQTITIPDNCVLQFEGGSINNGTINFNNCNIDNIGNSIILNNCTLKGSLNKQVIYSDWFYFNSDDCTDTLSNVFKISEGCRLIISEGVYKVSVKNLIGTDYADPMNTSILQPQSNSHITINGTIQLISNDRTHYNIIGIIDKDNILLDGTGEIIGDVETHTGTTGEWGHGVLISGSRNINVKDLRISYCWGDGLSVSYAEKILTDKGLVNSPYSPPEIINITNIKSSYNRRLGISIINGDGIILENSITEGNGTINGTSPKAGLDIEPNPNQSVNNVIVNGCLFYDNVVTYFPSNGLIKDEAISCIIQNSICKKQVTIGNVGKVIGCEIKYLLINGSRFVNIQNNVITEALVLSGTTITGLNVIDNTFLGLTTDGYDSCIRVSCDSFSKVNIASNNFSLCTNSNMRKLVTYTKKQTNAIDIVDSVITYDKTLTLLFYPYANFYNCEFIFSGFNIYNITSELDKYPDSCSFIGCKFAANNSSFYIRDNITDNYKITIENCEYYTKQDNPTDFINSIGHTIALDLVVLNNKGKSVFLKNDIDEAHKRPIINNNYNGHRFYNLTNKRPEYYYNNNWWDSCGYNVNENRNSDGTLIEKVRIVSDSSKIVNSNIIYVIVSDIDLQGETLTIPTGCTLDFQGGSFSNGTIIGYSTKVKGIRGFGHDLKVEGTWINLDKPEKEFNYSDYVFTVTYHNVTASSDKYYGRLMLYASTDGLKFNKISTITVPTNHLILDPSIVYFNDTFYIIYDWTDTTYNDYISGEGGNRIGILVSKNLIDWKNYDIDIPTSWKAAWAPDLFVDNNELYFSITTSDYTKEFTIPTSSTVRKCKNHAYICKLNLTDYTIEETTEMTNKIPVTDEVFNEIDPFIMKVDSTYYLFIKNEYTRKNSIYTSSTLTGNYTLKHTFNEVGEGVSVVKFNNRYYIYFIGYTNQDSGEYLGFTTLSTYIIISDDLETFTTPVWCQNEGNTYNRHSTYYLADSNIRTIIDNLLVFQGDANNADKWLNNKSYILGTGSDVVDYDNLLLQPDAVYYIDGGANVTINSVDCSLMNTGDKCYFILRSESTGRITFKGGQASMSGRNRLYFGSADKIYDAKKGYANYCATIVCSNSQKQCFFEDGIAGTILNSSTSTNRPVTNVYVGTCYFDTTLNKPIWAKTITEGVVTWVDATGTEV